MPPSSSVQPAPCDLVGRFVVGAGVAIEESAQVIGRSGMAQPGQGLSVELMSALLGHTQRRADLTVEEGAMSLQAIAGDDDVGQSRLQAVHHRQERLSNGICVQDSSRIRQVEALERNVIVIVSRDFEAKDPRKRLRVSRRASHANTKQSPGVDEKSKSLRRRYRRLRTAAYRFDCPSPVTVQKVGK
jgi:hypothetical protein